MKENTELHLDRNGNVDTDYYIYQAKILRSQHMVKLFTAFKRKLKILFYFELPTINADRPAHH